MSETYITAVAKSVGKILVSELGGAPTQAQSSRSRDSILTTAEQPPQDTTNEDNFTLVTRKKKKRVGGSSVEDQVAQEATTASSSGNNQGQVTGAKKRNNRGPQRPNKEALLKRLEADGPVGARAGQNAVILQAGEGGTAGYGEALKVLEKMVDPSSLGTTIKGITTTSRGQVVIRTVSKEDALKLGAELDKLENATVSWKTSSPRLPRMVLTGIPQSWEEREVHEKVTARLWSEVPNPAPTFRPLFKRGPKELYTSQWVTEVDASTRKKLKEGPINIGWLRIMAHDYIEQPRCYKCQAFGHISRKCPAREETCGWCAGNGHTMKNCPHKERPAICVNCHNMGLRKGLNHSTSSRRCSAYLRFLEKKIRITQYD